MLLFQCLNVLVQHGAVPDYDDTIKINKTSSKKDSKERVIHKHLLRI